ncbi:MAG: phospholipid-binding protein MlaC [Maricaulaceae bacterium]
MIQTWTKAAALAAVLFAPLGAATAQDCAAPAETAAEFVQNRTNEAIELITSDMSSEEFRVFLEEVSDFNLVGRYVLGRYARSAPPDKLQKFQSLFSDYAVSIYENQLDNYAGQTVEVIDFVEVKPRDFVVRSEVTRPEQDPLPLSWRVLWRNCSFRVVDVEVYGAWLAVQQQAQFTSIVGNAGGDVTAAIDALQAKIDDVRAEG